MNKLNNNSDRMKNYVERNKSFPNEMKLKIRENTEIKFIRLPNKLQVF